MFDALAAAIEGLTIPVDGDALIELIALSGLLTAKIVGTIGAFDAAALWDVDAATSMTAWLREHAQMARRDAVRFAHMASRLGGLPSVSAAFGAGRLSLGQVDAIVSIVPEKLRDVFEEHAAEIVESLGGLSVDDTTRVMRLWVAHAEAVHDEPEPDDEPKRSLYLSNTFQGRGVLDASLDPESTEIVATALGLAESRDTLYDIHRTPAERRADALTDICKFFLDHQTGVSGGRHRPHLNIVVDLDDFEAGRGGGSVNGTPLNSAVIGSLLCDCSLHRVLTKGRSSILDYGQATRTAPPNLFNALLVRDEHCRFGDCDRPGHWVDAHHVSLFEKGCPTSINRMVLLCRRHHRRLHQRGWHGHLDEDATFTVTNPHGVRIVSRPPRQQRRLLVDLLDVADPAA